MSDSHIRIAKIAGAHGLKGRLKIALISDIVERFSPGNQVYLEKGPLHTAYTIREFQPVDGKTALLYLSGIDDRDAALAMRGLDLFITREEAERTRDLLDEDSFYYYDIIGCEVYRNERHFGRVMDVVSGGAGELLVILDSDGREHLVPFVGAMVDTKGIKSRRIDIDPVEGLLD